MKERKHNWPDCTEKFENEPQKKKKDFMENEKCSNYGGKKSIKDIFNLECSFWSYYMSFCAFICVFCETSQRKDFLSLIFWDVYDVSYSFLWTFPRMNLKNDWNYSISDYFNQNYFKIECLMRWILIFGK